MHASVGMRTVRVEVGLEIAASAEDVWQVLVDIGRYSQWNPFIREAAGVPEVGRRVTVRPRTSIGVLAFHPTVIACESPHELRWRGRVVHDWLACGEHEFAIEELAPERVRLVQRMTFAGIAPRVMRRRLARESRAGFDAMNRAIARRLERARPASPRSKRERPRA